MAVRVECTEALRRSFASPSDYPVFVRAFQHWRQDWPANEFESEYFGKDGAYVTPKVDGRSNVLWHVHLKPVADRSALARWTKLFARRSRKTSDRALVYVHSRMHGYLLIAILEEPTAHTVARMETAQHAELMLQFATVAERFIDSGKVIA